MASPCNLANSYSEANTWRDDVMKNEDAIEVGKPSYVYKTIPWHLPALPSEFTWNDIHINAVTVWGNGNDGRDGWNNGNNLVVGNITSRPDNSAHVNIYLTQQGDGDTEFGVLLRYYATTGSAIEYFVSSGPGFPSA